MLAWSNAARAPVPLTSFAAQIGAALTAMFSGRGSTRACAARAIRSSRGKGATWYGIGVGLARIVAAIKGDEAGGLLSVFDVEPEVSGRRSRGAVACRRLVGRRASRDALAPRWTPEEPRGCAPSGLVLRDQGRKTLAL